MRSFIFGFLVALELGVLAITGWHAQRTRALDGDYLPPPPALPRYAVGGQSMLFLRMEKGTCTGVKVGQHTLLTAAHCWAEGGRLKQVNSQDVQATILANDGHDHILIRVDRPVPGRIAKLAKMPPVGSEVYLWGNPLDLRSVMRIGHVAGKWSDSEGAWDVLDVTCGPGDSGGAYFDHNGNVVGLVYGVYYSPQDAFSMGITHPWGFQPHQLEHLS